MGHRATYAILEGGKLELFGSRWGALSVPQDVFWGPEHAEAFIRSNAVAEDWYDDVFGEGGIGLDKDTRTILFFGGDELSNPSLRPLFLELMGALWQGWTLRWVERMSEIASHVGADPAPLVYEPDAPDTVPLDEMGKGFEYPRYEALLSVPTPTGWRDLVLEHDATSLLMNGPTFLEVIDGLRALDDIRPIHRDRPLRAHEKDKGSLGDHIDSFVVLDVEERTLWHHYNCVGAWSAEDAAPFVRERWPGWTLHWERGDAQQHFAQTDRPAPADLEPQLPSYVPSTYSRPEALALIERSLMGAAAAKDELQQFTTRVAATLADRVQGLGDIGRRPSLVRRLVDKVLLRAKTRFAAGFFDRVPDAGPSPEQQRALWARACRALEDGEASSGSRA